MLTGARLSCGCRVPNQKSGEVTMGMSDPVVWGSIAAVGVCIVIVVFLGFKVKGLVDRDTEAHKK